MVRLEISRRCFNGTTRNGTEASALTMRPHVVPRRSRACLFAPSFSPSFPWYFPDVSSLPSSLVRSAQRDKWRRATAPATAEAAGSRENHFSHQLTWRGRCEAGRALVGFLWTSGPGLCRICMLAGKTVPLIAPISNTTIGHPPLPVPPSSRASAPPPHCLPTPCFLHHRAVSALSRGAIPGSNSPTQNALLFGPHAPPACSFAYVRPGQTLDGQLRLCR